MTILLSGDATGGAFALFDELTDPGGGPPLHVHARDHEAFYILEGRFAFQVGDETRTVGPGDYLVAPPGIPHTFRNLDSTPARKLVLAWPAGVDQFFLEVGQPLDQAPLPDAPPDAEAVSQFVAAAARYGITIL